MKRRAGTRSTRTCALANQTHRSGTSEPREGRHNVAQGASPGLDGPTPLLYPLPRRAGEGEGGEGGSRHPTARAVGHNLSALPGLSKRSRKSKCLEVQQAAEKPVGTVILRSRRRRRIAHCVENTQCEILRFAQNDISRGLFRTLLRVGVQGCKALARRGNDE